MKKILLLGAMLLSTSAQAEETYTLDTQKGVVIAGDEKIHDDTSYRDLERKKLAKQFDGALNAGEGTCQLGTKIFRGSPKELEVVWKDSPTVACYVKTEHDWRSFKAPSFARITRSDSVWKTDSGIRIGTTLEELEKISGGSVGFIGMGWDYGGACCMGNFSKHIGFTVDVDEKIFEKKSDASEYYLKNLMGDKRIESKDIPGDIKKKLNITVKEIILNF